MERFRVATIMVDKNDTSNVKWDFGEFADWEVGALLQYILAHTETAMYVGFAADEGDDDDAG